MVKYSPWEMKNFNLDDEDHGICFDDFCTALNVMISTRSPTSVRDAALAFNVTDDVIRKAVDNHFWLLCSGTDDDATKQIVESIGSE